MEGDGGLEGLSTRELKQLLASHSIDTRSCFEKGDLIRLARSVGLRPPAAAAGAPPHRAPQGSNSSTDARSPQQRQDTGASVSAEKSSCTACVMKQDLVDLAVARGLLHPSSLQPISNGPGSTTGGGGFSMKVPQSMARPSQPQAPPAAEPEPAFDFSSQLGVFADQLRRSLLPILLNQFKGVQIDAIEDEIEAGKGLGVIKFGVESVEIENVQLPEEKLSVEIKDQKVLIHASEVLVELKKFKWHYKKLSFPKLSSSGAATCKISETSLDLEIVLDFTQQPPLRVGKCEVKIGNLAVDISETKAALVYKVLLKTLKGTLKAHLEEAFQNAVVSSVRDNASQLMADLA